MERRGSNAGNRSGGLHLPVGTMCRAASQLYLVARVGVGLLLGRRVTDFPTKLLVLLYLGWWCWLEEMIQQAFFHNMPLAFATAQHEPENYYISLSRELQSLLYWWMPDTTFTLENPSRVIFPAHSPAEYAKQIFKTQQGDVDLTKWAAAGPHWFKKPQSPRPILPTMASPPGCWRGSQCRSSGGAGQESHHYQRRDFSNPDAAHVSRPCRSLADCLQLAEGEVFCVDVLAAQ